MEENELKNYDPWEDEAFLNELDRRLEELESGKVQGVTLEEVKLKLTKDLRSF